MLDRGNTGFLTPDEFKDAIKNSDLGISAFNSQVLARGLGATDSSGHGFIPYKEAIEVLQRREASKDTNDGNQDASVFSQTQSWENKGGDATNGFASEAATSMSGRLNIISPRETRVHTEKERANIGSSTSAVTRSMKQWNETESKEGNKVECCEKLTTENAARVLVARGRDGHKLWFAEVGGRGCQAGKAIEWRPTKEHAISLSLRNLQHSNTSDAVEGRNRNLSQSKIEPNSHGYSHHTQGKHKDTSPLM